MGSSSLPSGTAFDLEESKCLVALWRVMEYDSSDGIPKTLIQNPPTPKVKIKSYSYHTINFCRYRIQIKLSQSVGELTTDGGV